MIKLAIGVILAFSVLNNTFTSNNYTFNSIAYSQDQEVIVQGSAAMEGSNKDLAQKKALSDAFRNAVEKGLGVWVKSQTEVKNFEVQKDQILTKSEGYVTDHEIINEGEEGGVYTVTIKAKVAVDKIGADFKKLVSRVKTQMNNPTIAFVLTTWESKGIQSKVNLAQNTDISLDTKVSNGVKAINVVENNNGSYIEALSSDPNMSINTSSKIKKEISVQKIDEALWKKYPDMTIIDSFQQEFIEKGFDSKATDEARQIAGAESMAQTSININDRKTIREMATNEGANYVARGELQVIDSRFNESTGNYVVTSKVGVEIIDVNSGDIVATYSNTSSASNNSLETAKAQSIKKVAVLASKTLASQTIDKWQDRANNGMKYTIEIRNVISPRSQKIPFIKALKNFAQVTSQVEPKQGILLIDIVYKGAKDELQEAILEGIASVKGFSESEFDGPNDENGKIVFKFIKK